MIGNSKIYNWLSLGIATVLTLIPLILLIIYGILCNETLFGITVLLVGIWSVTYFISYCVLEDKLSNKYEYPFENYIYRIRKDTLASGKERFYPIVSIAKYGTDQYIQETFLDKKVSWVLTKFTSKKEMKNYGEPAKNVKIYYNTEEEAKAAIESFKVYKKKQIELDKQTLENIEKEKRDNKVVSSEFLY